MWHEARANEKRIKELMVDHKKRAERRRAFYESRLGDPKQLLRVIGSSTKLYPDAEQFYYHENQDNLMPWQGNTDIRIDRFDGRSLLDYVPEGKAKQTLPVKEQHMVDELNFERYHDLVEADRLKVSERERLNEVEEEWTKLLERHKALLAMLNNTKKPEKGGGNYAYDYGTTIVESNDDLQNEEESQLLKEADILQYVDDLTDKDKKTLNDMASRYGIRNYSRLLRMTKRDRDEQLRELKAKQGKDGGKSKDKSSSGSSSRRSREERSRRRRRRSRYDRGSPSRGGRSSPTYEPYNNSSESDSSGEEDENTTQSEVVIEFGSPSSNVPEQQYDEGSTTRASFSSRDRHARERRNSSVDQHRQPQPQQEQEPKEVKKLTPMEKLRLKMREGLKKQIDADERERKRQEREMELNVLRGSYKGDRDVPENRLSAPSSSSEKKTRRYYSPSGSSASERTPSPTSSSHRKRRYRSPSTDGSDNNDDGDDRHSNREQRSSRHRRRSPSVKRSRHRSRSRSPSSSSSQRRYSSSSHHKSSHSGSSNHRHHHYSSSRSSRRRYRSRSQSRSRSSRHKRR